MNEANLSTRRSISLTPSSNLVVVDQVSHAGIEAHGHVGAHAGEHLGGLADARRGHVRVNVAATQKYGRALKPAIKLPACARGANHASAERDDAAKSRGVTNREFGGEARAL